MKAEQKEQYIKDGGEKCPYCKSTNITAGEYQYDSSWISRDVLCYDCGKSWREIFTLTAVEEME